MKYMLQFISPKEHLERDLADETWATYTAAWMSYMDQIYAAGVVLSGEALKSPDSATTVTMRSGERHVSDGPYVESKEMLGGYLIIRTESLDEALEWASKSPSNLEGATVVWPVLEVSL